MSVRDCVLIGIEGTHAAGKTTLVHALTAHYRQRGVQVDCTGEPARTSPFIEEIVIHGKGTFDLATEVDLFAQQLSMTLRTARHNKLLICDKTVVNVLAYARMVLPATEASHDADVLDAMAHFCRAWAPTYDAVFYLPDRYPDPADPFRAKVTHLQDQTAEAVRRTHAEVGLTLVEVPGGLGTPERIDWIARRVDPLLAGQPAILRQRDRTTDPPR
ncbi:MULTISPECIES: AAA family ATPase [Micromonospora]|uniref:Thymidylate kinase n=1 Tax=Micromonospora craniellae TaxID=2294034 RepID=A0A372FS48_9ACTN|nr:MULTISPECIES: AAA family ATPase [Micromonospora]MDG4793049.1 AAA family ATPase [Micromonospora sp. WMMD1082]QOC93513.1 ATP-binding protein [Micromonospora craniellae]RFS43444.1 thymidylate kinase [Micromonospora craniellae]